MEEIWLKFENKLRAFTLSKVYDKSVTDDIMQELFIRIHANIESLKDETKIQSWIYQICRNLIIDHFRNRDRFVNGAISVNLDPEDKNLDQALNRLSVNTDQDTENQDRALEGTIAVNPYPQDESSEIMTEALEDMVKMMDNLPPEYCEALCLTELGTMNQKEYADKIGISYSGAKSRVQRARKMLKDMLMQCCHYEFDKYGTVINIYPANCCCCHK